MEALQKYSTFEDLKKDEETVARPRFTNDIKQFLELMRQGEIPAKNAE